MLKIKDNVDLKELEKFGFVKNKLIYNKEIKKGDMYFTEVVCNVNIYIDEKTREIAIGVSIFNVNMELDTIYDLIQAGLVEKVSEE